MTDPKRHRNLPDVLSDPVLTDWRTVADVRAALRRGDLSGGAWLLLSLDHPELREDAPVRAFIAYASAFGVRVERSRDQPATAIYLRRPV